MQDETEQWNLMFSHLQIQSLKSETTRSLIHQSRHNTLSVAFRQSHKKTLPEFQIVLPWPEINISL